MENSGSQSASAFGSATCKNFAAVSGGHSLTEAVHFFRLSFLRLIRAFHYSGHSFQDDILNIRLIYYKVEVVDKKVRQPKLSECNYTLRAVGVSILFFSPRSSRFSPADPEFFSFYISIISH